jgi:flagellar biogenesis protein FliO
MGKEGLHAVLCITVAVFALCAYGQESADSILKETTPPVIDPVVPVPAQSDAPPLRDDAENNDRRANTFGFSPDQKAELDRLFSAQRSTAGTETIPLADSEGDTGRSTIGRGFEVLAVLLFLCAVIILLGYAVRRFGRRTPFLAGSDLGTVLGKVYLGPRASLHHVRSGGRVLVLGVTQNSVQLVTEFDESEFDSVAEEADSEANAGANFLQELQSRVAGAEKAQPRVAEADEGIASLRGELQRLQQHLGKSGREPDA